MITDKNILVSKNREKQKEILGKTLLYISVSVSEDIRGSLVVVPGSLEASSRTLKQKGPFILF